MNLDWSEIEAKIESYEEEIVRFQADLVSTSALGPVNGGDGELEKLRKIEKWVAEISPDEQIRVDAPDDRVSSGIRPNLCALFKGLGGPRVWVLSHVDIVPPGESSLWESDPFTLRREGDKIFGRGVEDNNQGLVSSYFAMKALKDLGLTPTHDVGLAFVADEETGSDYGLDYILKKRPDLFDARDLIIVPDGGEEDGAMIEVAEKSMVWLKFTVTGKQCHASTPDEGINSMRAAARVVTAVDRALPEAFSDRDELFTLPYSTFEPTKKEPNVPNVNTIPGEDVVYFDCRVLPRYDLEDVVRVAAEAAREAAAEIGAGARTEAVYKVQAPKGTPEDAPVVEALRKAVRRVHGLEARARGIGGGTVAAVFRKEGLPAAVWCTMAQTAHAPNEYALLSNIKADAKAMAHIYLGLD